jgi:hypothetical protein
LLQITLARKGTLDHPVVQTNRIRLLGFQSSNIRHFDPDPTCVLRLKDRLSAGYAVQSAGYSIAVIHHQQVSVSRHCT